MILQDINVGTVANDGTGDNPRAGALKINANNALIAAAMADKQPLDSDLTAIAALSTTSWGRALLTLGNAAALRALICSSYILGQSSSNSALTGSTAETALATIEIPAGAIGPNGSVEVDCWWSCTNNANNKTTKIKVAGNIISTIGVTTSETLAQRGRLANRNSQTSQVTGLVAVASGFGSSTASMSTFTIDTTVAQNITITGQLANSGDTLNLESYIVRVMPGA